MNKSPYKGQITIGTSLVCITKYTINKITNYGISIRYYAGKDDKGHKCFSGIQQRDNTNYIMFSDKFIYFSDFEAVIKTSDFDFKDDKNHINYYINNYSTK